MLKKSSKSILDNLFSSKTRVKILKFTFRNYPADFTVKELSRMIQEPLGKVKTEIDNLMTLGLIKEKKRYEEKS